MAFEKCMNIKNSSRTPTLNYCFDKRFGFGNRFVERENYLVNGWQTFFYSCIATAKQTPTFICFYFLFIYIECTRLIIQLHFSVSNCHFSASVFQKLTTCKEFETWNFFASCKTEQKIMFFFCHITTLNFNS